MCFSLQNGTGGNYSTESLPVKAKEVRDTCRGSKTRTLFMNNNLIHFKLLYTFYPHVKTTGFLELALQSVSVCRKKLLWPSLKGAASPFPESCAPSSKTPVFCCHRYSKTNPHWPGDILGHSYIINWPWPSHGWPWRKEKVRHVLFKAAMYDTWRKSVRMGH